ncbi:MFS transporter [Kribbella sp. NPDC050281]|uniref:MFS transporter n=1 Tax=Kribbella sp. NPDC050281 TaxID=3155515 RepID=UPI003410E5DB
MSGRGLLRNGDYLKLLSGQTISALGSAMSTFVFTLLAMAITGSPAQAGLVGAAYALGATMSSLPAGAVVDRTSRRVILISCGVAGAVLYGSVAVAGWMDQLTIWHLLAVALGSGVSTAFFMPAQNAALRQIVPPEDIGTAVAANQGRGYVASLAGAPLGGLLYTVGRVVPVAIDALSYLVMSVLLALIRHPLGAPETRDAKPEPMLRSIRSGITWLFRQPALRTIALVATALNFAANGTILVLILDLQQRGVRPSVIGLLETGMGVGGLLGAVITPKLLAMFSTGAIAIVGSWIVACTFTATAFTTAPAALVVLLSLAMLLLPALNSGLFGYQMLITPDHLQGRAQSAVMFLATSSQPLAPALGGLMLASFGHRAAVGVLGGILTVASLLLTLSRPIRSIPLLSEVKAAATV